MSLRFIHSHSCHRATSPGIAMPDSYGPAADPGFRTAERVLQQIEAAQLYIKELDRVNDGVQILFQAARSAQCLPDMVPQHRAIALEIARLLRLARTNPLALAGAERMTRKLLERMIDEEAA